MNFFRRNGRLRSVYFIPYNAVSWLSVCWIEDVFTLPLYASCLIPLIIFGTVSWCLSYVRGMNLLSSLTSFPRFARRSLTPKGRPASMKKFLSPACLRNVSPKNPAAVNLSRYSRLSCGFFRWIHRSSTASSQFSISSTVGCVDRS
jgi:hypothetical protein